ncbi:MAG: DEAD/DEAH box helicase, partial [Actinobacteria bacterium]|nr:DEAD/DEAH box helicase [Actinomycetota bacterium]
EGALDHPQERLLADLGHASRLYPALDGALDVPRPVELATDAAGAQAFLREAAPLLEQAGFGVLVPSWWRSGGARIGVRLKVRSHSGGAPTSASGLLGLEGLCEYRYDVALGDETLSATELRELARLKVPLVRVRGQWVELRTEDVRAALELMQGNGNWQGEMTAADVLRVGLGLAPSPAGLPVVGVEASGWLSELLVADRRLEAAAAPEGFRGILRPYQERGLAWLAFLDGLGLGACLADDMGLGKTVQLLALLLAERNGPRGHRARPRPTLLVCPMSVVGNWQREAERFAPSLGVHVHHGADRHLGQALAKAVRGADLVVTTYGLAARDREAIGAVEWGRIVLDEAQNIKNPSAGQTQAVRRLEAPRRVALTGTPVENRLSELWSIMEFLNPGLLGPARSFRERFAVPIERFRHEEATALLKRITGPFILRRLKTDRQIISDLPEKVEMKVFCNLTREQATLYQAVVDDMLARIEESEGIERRGLVLATMMKLKQACNHPAHLLADGSRLDGRSGKLARLEEILEEVLAEGDRALCFTQFAEMGHLLQARLRDQLGGEVPFLHGGVPKRARDDMVARFQDDRGPPVMLLSLKAGGVGLNLTAANHVIHFDRWWNPAVEDQATDRAFRIGQRRNVQVRKFVCVGTLEERIDRMIEEKRDLAGRIVGTGEVWLTELSTAELRELVALSADAVAEG